MQVAAGSRGLAVWGQEFGGLRARNRRACIGLILALLDFKEFDASGNVGWLMATGTYPLGSIHLYPYPLD